MAGQGGSYMNLGDVVNENVSTLTVPELISSLKSAFQKSYFTEVESVLVSREQKLQREIESKVKEYNLLHEEKELLEEKHGMEMMEKLRLQKELEGCRKACIELKEANSQLSEEHVRLAAIAEDKHSVITELKRKNCDLEWAKSKAEIDLDVYKTKCEELEKDLQTRVARLEKELAHLPNLEPSELANTRLSEGVFGDKYKVDCVKVEVDVNENLHRETGSPPGSCVPENQGGNLDSAEKKRPLSENIIEIPDSDNDSTCEISSTMKMAAPTSMDNAHIGTENGSGLLKRKWAFSVNEGENDNVQDAKVFIDGADSSSSSSSSSDSEDDVDFSIDFSCMANSWQRGHLNGSLKRWEFEADMINEFRKDEKLCMEAVCALYRHQIRGYSTSQNRGFDKLSTNRGTTLAKFLVDGDPEGKLKKSKADLIAYDNKGLDDCRSIAISHSKLLFEIYQKKEDALFLN